MSLNCYPKNNLFIKIGFGDSSIQLLIEKIFERAGLVFGLFTFFLNLLLELFDLKKKRESISEVIPLGRCEPLDLIEFWAQIHSIAFERILAATLFRCSSAPLLDEFCSPYLVSRHENN